MWRQHIKYIQFEGESVAHYVGLTSHKSLIFSWTLRMVFIYIGDLAMVQIHVVVVKFHQRHSVGTFYILFSLKSIVAQNDLEAYEEIISSKIQINRES